ncbi:TlpA family protein disulfide reductase [Brevibacillus fluminis]|uniref:TlpA family protein disulfide reductase n=1 Tax=Brevibacillus fluminis TaxID=511487 RepID=UPI003F8B41C7
MFQDLSHILLWIVTLIQMAVMYFLVRLVVQFLNRFRLSNHKVEMLSLQVGQGAPAFREKDQNGVIIQPISENESDTLLFFINDTCPTCKTIIPSLHHFQTEYPDVRIVAVSGRIYYQQSLELPSTIPLIRSDSLFTTYFITNVPTAVFINSQGIIKNVEAISSIAQFTNLLKKQSKQAS